MPLYIYFIHDIFLVFLTGPTKSEEKRKFKNNINIYMYIYATEMIHAQNFWAVTFLIFLLMILFTIQNLKNNIKPREKRRRFW